MRWLSAGLCYLLLTEFVWAPAAAQTAPVTKLNLVVVEGEGAINNIRLRTAREPIVQVEDQNHKPVAGAVVVFTLPQQGASGIFPNGAKMLTVLTDDQGRAVARGLQPNNVSGKMQIRVNASFQGQTASTSIAQTNVAAAAAGAGAGAGAVSGKLIAIVAIAAAGVAGGVVAATRGGGSTAAVVKPPTSIAPGGGTVGPPR